MVFLLLSRAKVMCRVLKAFDQTRPVLIRQHRLCQAVTQRFTSGFALESGIARKCLKELPGRKGRPAPALAGVRKGARPRAPRAGSPAPHAGTRARGRYSLRPSPALRLASRDR